MKRTFVITEIKQAKYGYKGYYSSDNVCELLDKHNRFNIGDVITKEFDNTNNVRSLWCNNILISTDWTQEGYDEFHGQMYNENKLYRKAIEKI